MILLETISALVAAHPEAVRVRIRTYGTKSAQGTAPAPVCADGAELPSVSLACPLDAEGEAAARDWHARAASASWSPGRNVRLEALNGAGEPLGSRSVPGHHWSGAAAPGAVLPRPPWSEGPVQPSRWPAARPLVVDAPVPVLDGYGAPDEAPTVWRPPVNVHEAARAGHDHVEALLRQNAQLMGANLALVQQATATSATIVQVLARVVVEGGAQAGQTARSAHAQLASLSGTVAAAATAAAQRAEDEAAIARAAVEAAAAADKTAAVSEALRVLGASAEGPDRWGQILTLATTALGSGALSVRGRPGPAAPAQVAAGAVEAPPVEAPPVEAPPVEAPPVEAAPWAARLVDALKDADADPTAGAQLQALGALLPASVRAQLAAGLAS